MLTTQQQKEKQHFKKQAKNLNTGKHFSKDIQLVSKHMKIYSISLVIGEMKIKITVRYHFTLT